MQDAIEPDRFHAIVIGTGLPESILAAAAASKDRQVLHVDAAEYYGGNWASVIPDQLVTSFEINGQVPDPLNHLNELNELGLVEVPIKHVGPSQGEVQTHNNAEVGSFRAYNLDVAGPKLAYSGGPLIDLLLKSGTHEYLEFKAIEACFVWNGKSFASTPTSRNEVFKAGTPSVWNRESRAHLRNLGKFLKSVEAYFNQEEEVFSEEELKLPVAEFLNKQMLAPEFQTMLIYGLVLVDEDQEESKAPVSAAEALQTIALNRFSMGRFFEAGAFLYPFHGQGELPQAFCRRAAVNGALYVLRRPVSSILVEKETGEYKGIRTVQGQLLYSEKLILGSSYKLVENTIAEPTSKLAKFVCITDDSLHPTMTNILLVFPPRSINKLFSNVVRVVQLGGNTAVCPRGKYVVQVSTLCNEASVGRDVLDAALEILFGENDGSNLSSVFDIDCLKPKVLWSAYYVEDLPNGKDEQLVRDRIGFCPSPGPSLDYRRTVAQTVKIFHQLFGDDEWFPRDSKEEVANHDGDNGSKNEALS